MKPTSLPPQATPASEGDHSAGPGKARIPGIDAARALAVIGMVAVHVGPEDIRSLAGRIYALAHGRASVLFVLLAGVGIALLSSREGTHADARLRLASFALVLLPLGLVLQEFGYPIAVILHHYAAFYLLGIFVLALPGRRLLVLAAVMSVLGPLLYSAAGRLTPGILDGRPVSITDGPLTIAMGLLISGPYPLLVWCAPLLWGLWLGRQDLRVHRRRVALCLVGAGVALAMSLASTLLVSSFGDPLGDLDWRMLLVDKAHSEMPFWLVSSLGSAMFVLGAALIAADRFRGLAQPFAALGQLALTMYVAHVLALHWWREALTHDTLRPAVAVVLLLSAAAMLFAMAWRRVARRGPLETLMHLPWQLMDQTLGGRSVPGTRADSLYAPERVQRIRRNT